MAGAGLIIIVTKSRATSDPKGNSTMKSKLGPVILATIAAGWMLPLSAAPVSGQGIWETTLQARYFDGDASPDAYYDTVLGITWLANANAAAGSAADDGGSASDGRMTRTSATAWLAGLDAGGTTGWRLPFMVDTLIAGCDYSFNGTDCGYNVQTMSGATVYGELAHLFHVTLGNQAFYTTTGSSPQPGWGLTNTGPFSNVQPYDHWSDTFYSPSLESQGLDPALFPPVSLSWVFNFSLGRQNNGQSHGYEYHAWAVHAGDVGAVSPVPVPPTIGLFASCLAGLIARVRTRRRGAVPA